MSEESNLERHARRELELAGLLDKRSYYDGELALAVLDLIRLFASHGHSGGSASLTIDLFSRLARFKTLTPVTSDPREWMEVGHGVWQNTRQSSIFSTDNAKTHYDIDEEGRPVRVTKSRE